MKLKTFWVLRLTILLLTVLEDNEETFLENILGYLCCLLNRNSLETNQ